MRIGIIGAGSVGLFYACQFSAHFPVTLYVKREAQIEELEQHPVTLFDQEGKVTKHSVSIEKYSKNTKLEEDVILVAVKQYAISSVIPSLTHLEDTQTVVFLQNGMSHLEALHKIPKAYILLGVVEHGIRKVNEYSVEWTGKGKTKVASYQSPAVSSLFIEKWQQALAEDFPVMVCSEYHTILTEKLLVNAVINPLTALYGVKNGELLTNPAFNRSMRILYEEISFIVTPESREDIWQHINQICEKTAENWSSMERDLHYGRETEIDSILGYIISIANQEGKNLPVTEFMYKAIKGLQSRKSRTSI